jgi:hypothetical protein
LEDASFDKLRMSVLREPQDEREWAVPATYNPGMPAKPTIREATEVDLPELVALLAQLAPDDPQREDMSSPLPYEYHMVMRQIIGTPGQHIFVLEERGKIVGTAALSVVPNVSHRARRTRSSRTFSSMRRRARRATANC